MVYLDPTPCISQDYNQGQATLRKDLPSSLGYELL
jgi:hypothetical protein